MARAWDSSPHPARSRPRAHRRDFLVQADTVLPVVAFGAVEVVPTLSRQGDRRRDLLNPKARRCYENGN